MDLITRVNRMFIRVNKVWKSSSLLLGFTILFFCLLTRLKAGLHVIFKGLVLKRAIILCSLKENICKIFIFKISTSCVQLSLDTLKLNVCISQVISVWLSEDSFWKCGVIPRPWLEKGWKILALVLKKKK